MRVYVWDRCFILQSPSSFLTRSPKPHKRLSATIIVSNTNPFVMEIVGQPAREYEGLILAPNVSRVALSAQESELTILDAGITTPMYRMLEPILIQGQTRILTSRELTLIRPLLAQAHAVEMNCPQAVQLFDEVAQALGGISGHTTAPDPRIQRVLQLIEELPLDELSLPMLARAAGLSESRLRALFQKNLGCGPAQYMRWVNAWKVIRLWEKGKKFTDLAHEMGFHDLAHIDHALKELFGVSPSTVTTAQGVSFHKCGP